MINKKHHSNLVAVVQSHHFRKLLTVVVSIELNKRLPFFWNFIFHENGIYGTFWFAQTAVNTFVWVDEKLGIVFPTMDTVNRAHRLARAVLDTDTGLRNHKRHLDLHLQGRRFAESVSSSISLPRQNYNDVKSD
jgi:hypothetical protein